MEQQQQQQQLEILDNDDVAEHDHLCVDIQEIWEILGQKCPEDILAGKVQEGLPELEMATSKGNGDILDFENGASHISSESISENPFVYNHQNQESSGQGVSPSSVSLSDWMLADSDPNAVTNPLIHDFPTHGIDYHDESRHDIPNLVPRFGLTPEDRPEDVPMKKLNVNRSDHFDSSKYITRISDRSESGELSSMDMDTPITWEPFGSYDPFIHNNIDMSIPNDSLPDLSSQPIVQHNNIKYEDNNYASSNKQNPNKLNIRLKPISPLLPCTSADMYENNLVSLKKQSGKNLVSKGLNYSSYYGTHKKSPAGNDLSKMFPPRISWNLSKNISGHVKSEYEDSKRALENISGHVKDEEEDWFSKRDREDISGHVKDEKEDWLSGRARVNILGHVKDEKEDWFSKRACENISGHVKDEKEDCFSKRARETDNGKVLSQKKDLMKRARQNYYAGISANKNLNSAVGDHITDSKALNPLHPQSFTSTNRFYCEKEESVTAHSTAFVISFQVDNDDVCIIEGPGAPVLSNSLYINRNPISNSRMLPVIDPLKHVGMGGVKVKANDERQVLRVALQDLSQSKTEARLPDGIMAVPLLKHQRIALSWMIKKETGLHCSGGFLADDQGLGKTISTIALIVKEKPPTSSIRAENKKPIKTETLNLDEDVDYAESCPEPSNRNSKGRPSGGTLVVCPTSVLRQWAEEIRDKITQRERLSVLIYHGSNRTKDPSELEKYDVVLTTYSIVGVEVPKQPLVDKDEISKKRKSEFPSTSKKSRKKVREKEKDLFVGPLAKVGWFRVVLDEAQSIKNYKTQVARACWGLRAKRRWCLSGTPIQNSIDDLYSYFRFLRYEPYATYKSFVSSIRIPINRNRTTGYKKLQAVLKTVMLRRTKGTILDGEPIINLPPKTVELKKVEFTKEERDFYCQLESDSQAQFEEYAAAGTVKQNYVNILLLLLRLRQACDHPLLVRRNDSSSEWKSSVEMAKKLPREKQVALLSCLEASLAICGLCNDPPEDAVVTTCEHVFCYQCIYQYMGDDNQCPDTNCKNKLSAKLVFSTAALKYCLSDNFSEVSDKLEPSAWDLPFESSKIKAALEVLNSFCNPKPVIDDVPSPPKMSLDPFEIKEEVSDDDTDEDSKQSVKVNREKAIVFSQWTRMLDLLEPGLKSSNIQYRRLDGTMSVLDRDKAVKEFKTLPEVTVMIMSLKAASLGLNMVAACRVILLDLWWNPTTEDQAVDRAHRIGQTRPVSVLRLTVEHTVEDRILALQQKKREMVASAFGEDETGSGQTRLTVEDLKYLFRT